MTLLELITSEGPAEPSTDATPTLGKTSVLRGCNTYASSSVIVQRVKLGALAGRQTGTLPSDFSERFLARFGTLPTWHPETRFCSDFLTGLKSVGGQPIAEVLLQAILAVEASVRFMMCRLQPIAFARIVQEQESESASLVWHCEVARVSCRVAPVALLGLLELLPAALGGRRDSGSCEFAAAHEALLAQAKRHQLPYNLAIMVQAASQRGIPWEHLGGSTLRLGQGSRQRYFRTTATAKTSFIAQRFAKNKRMSNRVLATVGVPLPKQVRTSTVDGAVKAAESIGYPVVVKPVDGNMGRGVSVGVTSPVELQAAFERAKQFGSGVVIESQVIGEDYRLLIVGGRLVAATRRIPPAVTGDGKRSIGELVDVLNRERDGFTLVRVTHDAELDRLLDKSGYTLETILPTGKTFALRSMSNYHTGGITFDVTDVVHPDNREVAIRAAQVIGLDIAGIDFLTSDIGRSYRETGGAVIEINARPGLDLHARPAHGKPRDVAGAVIESIIPPGDQARIPVGLIAPRVGLGAAVAEVLARVFFNSVGKKVAVVAQGKAMIDDTPLVSHGRGTDSLIASAFRDSRVDALIQTISWKRVAQEGLLHDLCDVTVLTETPRSKQGREGVKIMAKATRGKLVVPARAVAALRSVLDVDSRRLVLVVINAGRNVERHLKAGGTAIMVRGRATMRSIEIIEGDRSVVSIALGSTRALLPDMSRAKLRAWLFALAIAHELGMTAEQIRVAMTDEKQEQPVPTAALGPSPVG